MAGRRAEDAVAGRIDDDAGLADEAAAAGVRGLGGDADSRAGHRSGRDGGGLSETKLHWSLSSPGERHAPGAAIHGCLCAYCLTAINGGEMPTAARTAAVARRAARLTVERLSIPVHDEWNVRIH